MRFDSQLSRMNRHTFSRGLLLRVYFVESSGEHGDSAEV
jgi:hypothetical protein